MKNLTRRGLFGFIGGAVLAVKGAKALREAPKKSAVKPQPQPKPKPKREPTPMFCWLALYTDDPIVGGREVCEPGENGYARQPWPRGRGTTFGPAHGDGGWLPIRYIVGFDAPYGGEVTLDPVSLAGGLSGSVLSSGDLVQVALDIDWGRR